MDPTVRESLKKLLHGYFGEFNFDESAYELALVTDAEEQRAYLSMLDAGIAAAAQGDEEIPALIRYCLGGTLVETGEAKTTLEEIRAAYVKAIARVETGS